MSLLVPAILYRASLLQIVAKVSDSRLQKVAFELMLADCAAQLSFQSVTNQSYYLFIGSNTNNPEETIGSFELRYYDSSCRTDTDCVDESDMCDTAQCLVGTHAPTSLECKSVRANPFFRSLHVSRGCLSSCNWHLQYVSV